MRQVGPIQRRFRNALVAFRYIVKDNWLMRRIVYLLRKLECLRSCQGDQVTDTVEVTSEVTLLRYPDLWAKSTEIANTGGFDAVIYENSVIAGIVQAGTSKRFKLSNRYLLDAKSVGDPTTLVVTTNRRCDCGDTDPKPYGQTIAPIGGNLL